jgi:hypothetical protein
MVPSRMEPSDARPLDYHLVEHETWLADRAQVERHLPDILGRALARAWIDPGFRMAFVADPKATLARCRLHLPDSIGIEVREEAGKRPMVIVNEVVRSNPRRILFLQLVMVAGR